MLKLESVAAFVSILETGSIAGGARRLGVSKSVVSERLTDLERVLGALLATFYLNAALRDRMLRVIDVGADPEGATIFVAYPQDLRTSVKIRTLIAWLKQAFGDPPYWGLDAAGVE